MYDLEDGNILGNNAEKKPLRHQGSPLQNLVDHKNLVQKSRSLGHSFLLEPQATLSHPSHFHRVSDAANCYAFEFSAASVMSEHLSSTTSTSNSGKATKCHICLKPPTTAFSQPLIQCALCRRRYHSECHSPPAPLGDNIGPQDTTWICSRCTRPSKHFSKMENSYLAPWILSSNASRDGPKSPLVAHQRTSKRRRTQAHVPDSGGTQMKMRRETSARSVGGAEPPACGSPSNTTGFPDRKSMRVCEPNIEKKNTGGVWQPVCSVLQTTDVRDSEQQKLDPETISRLMEMADSDSRLEHLVEVLHDGKASASEREEWNRFCNSSLSSVRPLEFEQVKKHTTAVIASQISPKTKLIPSKTLHCFQSSNLTSVIISGSGGNELSPPYTLTGHQHDKSVTQCSQDNEVVFLRERPWTAPKQTGASYDTVTAKSPSLVSPNSPLVVEKSGVIPTPDPFAQAKKKRAQAQAELARKQKSSENIDNEEVMTVVQCIAPTATSTVIGESTSLQTLLAKVQILEGSVAQYQAELQLKNTKLQSLSVGADRERSELRLHLRKSKQQVAGLRIQLEESQRAVGVAQTRYQELRSKMERTSRPISDNPNTTACTTQDVANIELSSLRSEVGALRSLIAAKDKPYPNKDFVHRNLFLAPLVQCGKATINSRGRGRPPKSISSLAESDPGTIFSEDKEESTNEEEYNLTRNERALREFDKAIGLPQNPVAVRVDGMLAYRDGTRDANGRLPRAKNLFKVGLNVPGELK